MTLAEVVRGVGEVARAALGLDLADAVVVQARKRTCTSCEHRVEDPLPRCLQCGCFLRPKLALAGQSCPLERW